MIKYYDPEGHKVENPDEKFVDLIFNEKDFPFWNSGGNGEQIFFFDEEEKSEMVLTQPEFGNYFIRIDEMSPFDGSSYDAILVSECGGNPMPIPRCMLVCKELGIETVKYFLKNKTLNHKCNWANYFESPIDWEAYI